MGVKYSFDSAIAFAAAAEGTYDSVLDGITTVLRGDPDTTDEGLVLGSPTAGVGETGIDFSIGARLSEKAHVGASYTRPIDDFLAAENPTFSFTFPFCGNRANTHATTVEDADFTPLVGVDAILQGAGLVGAGWGAGVGWSYTPDITTALPFSALLYLSESRYELKDCRTSSLSVAFTPGSIPLATAEIAVGSVKDPASTTIASAALPTTLTYGGQASVSAPTVETVAHLWKQTRGFTTLTLNIGQDIEDIPDSNDNATGFVKDATGREITIDATMFIDNTADEDGKTYETSQVFATAVGDLDPLSFTVGTAQTSTSSPATAVYISAPTPRLREFKPERVGTKAGGTVSLVARGATAGSELEIRFI